MHSANTDFDNNSYAHRQQDHHQRMLKQLQMGASTLIPFSSCSVSDPSTPVDIHTPSRADTSTSGDSFSLHSPPPFSATMSEPFLAQQQQKPLQQPVSPFNYAQGVYNNLPETTMTQSAWLPQNVGGNAPQQASSSLGLGLDFNSFHQPCDEALGLPFASNYSYGASTMGQPFPASYGLTSAHPNFVQMSQVGKKIPDSADYPPSPLRSISRSSSPQPRSKHDEISIKGRLRRTSGSSYARSSTSGGKRGHKRKTTWTEGMAHEGPNVSREQKEQELAQLERMEDDADPEERRARRRLQNRLAQRAFRARSKVYNREAQSHLTELEDLVEAQNEQIQSISASLDRLQRENAALKAGQWAMGNTSYNYPSVQSGQQS